MFSNSIFLYVNISRVIKYLIMKKIFFLALVCALFLMSCASRKDLVYLQASETTAIYNSVNASSKLSIGDIISISVSADDVRATEPFNPTSVYSAGNSLPKYTLDNDGFISFPKIGRIYLLNKTRVEAAAVIKSELEKYIINPIIDIVLVNANITVLGEVKSPGAYPILKDKITIFEGLGLAGDLTINGIRNNVLVLREKNGIREEIRIDLTSKESFNSPGYYLSQNDVVYVEPNKARMQSAKYTQNTSVFVSVASLIIGLTTLIIK